MATTPDNTEAVRLWLSNDEGLWLMACQRIRTATPDTMADRLRDSLSHVLALRPDVCADLDDGEALVSPPWHHHHHRTGGHVPRRAPVRPWQYVLRTTVDWQEVAEDLASTMDQ